MPNPFKSPLTRTVVLAVFGSFVFIEVFVLLGTFMNQRNVFRSELAAESRWFTEKLVQLVPPSLDMERFESAATRALADSDVIGAHITVDGTTYTFGDAPTTDLAIPTDGSTAYADSRDGLVAVFDANGVRGELMIDTANMNDRLNQFIMNTILVVLFIGLGVTIATMFVLGRSVISPVQRIRNVLMSENQTQDQALMDSLPTRRTGEVGDVGRAVLVYIEAQAEVARLREESAEAERRAEVNRKESLAALAVQFEGSVGEVVKTVSAASSALTQLATDMGKAAEGTSERSVSVASAAEQASASVQTVASAAEELSASINEITQQVSVSSAKATEAVSEANRVNEDVGGLAEAARKIGEVVNLINDIAEQTNLLALNATIEAARAGEAGKGFAVVASEVKSLANQTAKATGDISSQIEEIQRASDRAVTSIQGIGKTIGQLNEIASGIAAAVEEQGASTSQIAQSISQVADGTREVTGTIQGVTQAAGDTSQAANGVKDAAQELCEESERLRNEVDGFLAAIRQ